MRKNWCIFLVFCILFSASSCQKENEKRSSRFIYEKWGKTTRLGKKFDQYTVIFPFTDIHGNEVNVSMYVAVPIAKKPYRVILDSHYTQFIDAKVPSNTPPDFFSYGLTNAIVISTDYVGYGVSREKTHIYIDAMYNAHTQYEGLKVAYDFLKEELGLGNVLENTPLCFTGVSQGATVALATQKLIENDDWHFAHNFKYSIVGAGPYDMYGTVCLWFDKMETCYYPASFAFIANELIETNSFGNLQLEDIFTEDFLATNAIEQIKVKDRNMNDVIFAYFEKKYGHPVSNVKVSDIFLSNKGEARDLLDNYLKKCDYLADWTPKNHIKFYHSPEDNVIPIQIADNLENMLKEKGCSYSREPISGIHLESAIEYYTKLVKFFLFPE